MLTAQITEAASTMFRWGRIQENGDWLLPLVVFVLLAAYFVHRYRIDAAELKRRQRGLLLLLRLATLFTLLLFYLHPQWEHLVGSSRVAVLIDSSASMARRDLTDSPGSNPSDLFPPENDPAMPSDEIDSPNEAAPETGAGPTRLEGVLDWMERSELIDRLSEKHDVVVYSFDRTLRPMFRQQPSGAGIAELSDSDTSTDNGTEPRESDDDAAETTDVADNDHSTDNSLESLKPRGEETRLGEALFDLLQRERGRPLAGIVLLSDGRNNGGRSPDDPLEAAARLRIPILPIGVGQVRQPLNFRIGNIDVPDRAFPDDPFTVKIPVEMIGGEEQDEGRRWTIPLELWARREHSEEHSEEQSHPETKIGEKELHFPPGSNSGGVVEAEFEIRFTEPGKQRLTVKILPPEEDHHPADDRQETDIEIVDRKDRVLLFASGPMRDYQFLCSQIHRDKSMSVDVYLPWTKPGSSQNADQILDRFPATRNEMSQYDVVVAFDPNWRDLSDEQIDILEHWVARQGGGLILFAGPIQMADTVTGWVTDHGMEKIRTLYPVEFLAKQSAFDHRYHGGEQAWPPKFTRAGEEADFLRPLDNPVESRTFWSEFPGFYGFFAVRGVKPTATLLVASGSPETMGRNETGALVVEQLYGAGRILYFGSAELWRLRRSDERAFEQIAARVLRHVAQGRLQRDSDRGSLSTDKRRYALGSIAQIRVTANDGQLKPLTAPTLPIDVVSPSGTLRTVDVTLDPNIAGTYQAHLPLIEEGTWSIRFPIPDGDQQIVRTVQVRMSDLERENPSRNEPLLRRIATKSGGAYYPSPTEALPLLKESNLYGDIDFFASSSGDPTDRAAPLPPITELLKVRSQRAVLDQAAEEKTMRWFLIALCSFLLLEWTARRLMKLA